MILIFGVEGHDGCAAHQSDGRLRNDECYDIAERGVPRVGGMGGGGGSC